MDAWKYHSMDKKDQQKKQPEIPKWRVESGSLRGNLKAGRGETLTQDEQDEQDSLAQATSYGLDQCKSCGRKFKGGGFAIHAPICAKIFKSKREQFDSAKMRLTNAQILLIIFNKENEKREKWRGKKAQQKKKTVSGPKGKTSNWKEESEAFRANLKNKENLVQEVSFVLIESENRDRKINENATARHIPLSATENIPDQKKYIEFLEKKVEQLQQELANVKNQFGINNNSLNQLPQADLGVAQENRPNLEQKINDNNNHHQENVPYYLNKASELIETIPEKANGFQTNLAQIVEGDIFIHCPEGK